MKLKIILMHDYRWKVRLLANIFAPASEELGHFLLDGANLQMQTQFVPKMRHVHFAVILWQLHSGKISFAGLLHEI